MSKLMLQYVTAAICPCMQDFGHVLVDDGAHSIKLKWC